MAGVVEIWSIDLPAAARGLLELEAEAGLLTSEDRAAAARFADQETATRRLAVVIGLRLLMSGVAGREAASRPFVRSAQGKPQLPGLECHFNVSHSVSDSGMCALLALSTDKVGVDIEAPRGVRMDARRRCLIEMAAVAVAEATPLPDATGERRFLQAWTRLEALAKADGCGIGRILTEIGAVGRRPDLASGELPSMLQTLMAAHVTRDLVLDGGAIGALSISREVVRPDAVRRLPQDRDALEALRHRQRVIGQA